MTCTHAENSFVFLRHLAISFVHQKYFTRKKYNTIVLAIIENNDGTNNMHNIYLYIPYFQVKPRKHVSRDMQKIRDKRKKDAGGIFLGERKFCNIYVN